MVAVFDSHHKNPTFDLKKIDKWSKKLSKPGRDAY